MPIIINCNNPPGAVVHPPGGVIGEAYSHFITSDDPGAIIYIFPGILPSGLTLNEDGTGEVSGVPDTISWTPAEIAAGSQLKGVTVNAINPGSLEYGSIICGFSSYLNCLPLTPTDNDPPNGSIGLAYSHAFGVSSGGIAPFSYAVTGGALPDGLTMDGAGVISGVPTTNGNFTFFLTVTGSGDPINNVATISSHINVGGGGLTAQSSQLYYFSMGFVGPLSIGCGDPPVGTLGVAYSHLVPILPGGTAPYTYAITFGALPDGLALDPDTGIISGTPTTVGVFGFTVQVTDADLTTDSVECSIAIGESSVTIECNNPPDGTVNVPYSHMLVVSGGTPPYTVTLIGGTLPDGLVLDSSGLISGVPTLAGTFTFTAQVEDDVGDTAEVECSIEISDGGLPRAAQYLIGNTEQLVCDVRYPWSIPPHQRTPWKADGSITAPAVGTVAQIWEYLIPDNFYLVLDRTAHFYDPPGLMLIGSGEIVWIIDVDVPLGNPLATWRPLAQFTAPLGSVAHPFPVGPLQLRGGQTIRYKVVITDPAVPVGAPNVISAVAEGWLYPVTRSGS